MTYQKLEELTHYNNLFQGPAGARFYTFFIHLSLPLLPTLLIWQLWIHCTKYLLLVCMKPGSLMTTKWFVLDYRQCTYSECISARLVLAFLACLSRKELKTYCWVAKLLEPVCMHNWSLKKLFKCARRHFLNTRAVSATCQQPSNGSLSSFEKENVFYSASKRLFGRKEASANSSLECGRKPI